MPNPYHDETGRFCSKEEMGAAVERLEHLVAAAPDEVERGLAFDAYFGLRKEYENINRDVVEVPTEWVGKVANSGLSTLPATADGIEAYYRSGFGDGVLTGSFHTYGDRAVALLTSPATPRWIKHDLYENASADVKNGVIQRLSRGEDYPEITATDLLPFARGENGGDWDVQQALLSSKRIGVDAKYELAKRTRNLGTFLNRSANGAAEANLYATIPDIEQDLFAEADDQRLDSRQRSRATNAIAANSPNDESLLKLIAREEPNSYALALVALNKHLSQGASLRLLTKVAEGAPSDFPTAYEYERTKQMNDPRTGRYAEAVRRYEREIVDYAGDDAAAVIAATNRVTQTNSVLESFGEESTGSSRYDAKVVTDVLGRERAADYYRAQMVLDAQPDHFAALEKKRKQLDKAMSKAARSGNRYEFAGAGMSLDFEAVKERLKVARLHREAQVLLRYLRTKSAVQA